MKRKANFELLRIVAMLMIVTLHYLDKGRVLADVKQSMGMADHCAWLLEALCIIAVNVYVLLSGYLGYESEMKLSKITGIWGKVLFYSVVLTIPAFALGIYNTDTFGTYDLIDMVLPLSTNRYWFATGYFVLLLLTPFLNKGIKTLEQKHFKSILIALVVFFSVIKTVVPYSFPHDNAGYDVLWFVVLYLTGAYFGKYGFNILNKAWKGLALLVFSVLCIWGMQTVLRYIYLKTGSFENFIQTSYHYNSLWVYIGAVSALALFSFIRINEGKAAGFIRWVALCTFGVYLIHEHPAFRYEWPKWFKVHEYADNALWPLHMIATVICIFTVCAVVELIRIKIAAGLAKCYNNKMNLKKEENI